MWTPTWWAAFLLMWGYLVGHLILVRSCAFCLDLWSVFTCSWSVFLPLFHLHSNNYQHSWKWSVIVAEPPELSRLKCAGHHHKGNTDTNALQTEQFLVCRVTSRLKASRPLIRVLVINDNDLWINDFIWDNEYRLIHGWKTFGCERMEFWRWWAKLGHKAKV